MRGPALRGLVALLFALTPWPGWGASVAARQVKPVLMPVSAVLVPGLGQGLAAPTSMGQDLGLSWAHAPSLVQPQLAQAFFAVPPSEALTPGPLAVPSAGVAEDLSSVQGLASPGSQDAPEEASYAAGAAVFDQARQGSVELSVPAPASADTAGQGNLSRPSPKPAQAEAPKVEKADESEGLATQGLQRRWERLYLAGQELVELGRGAFGAVYEHPRLKGAVIKMVALSAAAAFAFGGSDLKVAMQDYQVGKAMAEAGAGPKLLGLVSIPGEPSALRRWVWGLFGKDPAVPERPAVVKERVFGETVEDLIDSRRFSQRDYVLVQDMLGRLADARLRPWDLRTANVMIGTTESDPEPKAYLVDAGWLKSVDKAETREELFESLKNQSTVVFEFGGGSANWGGPERGLDPFDHILQQGLLKSRGS
ncbi:MAG: hypothetical protein HY924_10660 [Elusimicrobia bacterium]|nr:hypothetical protein [Elusimicrobiota bacterium]